MWGSARKSFCNQFGGRGRGRQPEKHHFAMNLVGGGGQKHYFAMEGAGRAPQKNNIDFAMNGGGGSPKNHFAMNGWGGPRTNHFAMNELRLKHIW